MPSVNEFCHVMRMVAETYLGLSSGTILVGTTDIDGRAVLSS